MRALTVALVATLAGTGATLYSLGRLLAPLGRTSRSLRRYLETRELPDLPTQFTDDAGILMADTQHTVEKIDAMIVHLSHYDALTALPNRTLFEDRLGQAITGARREGRWLAVIAADVDGLKNVNALYGRDGGDKLLQAIAARWASLVRDTDVFSRVGADTFALLQTEMKSSEDIYAIDAVMAQAQRLLASVNSAPFLINNKPVGVTVSIGIALYPGDDGDADGLLRDAEAAVDQAQKAGVTNQCQFYSPEMNAQMRERLIMESEFGAALEREEFTLHYQPQVDLGSNKIMGIEALVRWNHPVRGLLAPGDFIAIAERCGFIVPLGEWVLRTACRQNKAWQDAGYAPIRVAVNLSARQFRERNLLETVASALRDSGLDPAFLELEVTESLAMDNVDQTIEVLQKLRDQGIALSLDDFGTGYSSLSQLRRLPIDTLKIDRAFVSDVLGSDDNAAVTTSIIGLAHNLRLHVIAEGVETEAQAAFLRAKGCGLSQGYLFSRPVPAQDIAPLLAQSDADSVSATPAPAKEITLSYSHVGA